MRERISIWTVDKINELEPTKFPETPTETAEDTEDNVEGENTNSNNNEALNIDEDTGQISLF